jgi:hypothetical protein
MAVASLVVMIDASSEGSPGELHVRSVSHSAQLGPVGTHYTTPEELAALTAGVYGHCPPVAVVTMTGANFSIGEQFSAVVAHRIPLMSAVVRKVCVHGQMISGSLQTATRVTVAIGLFIAYLMILWGIWLFFGGAVLKRIDEY